MRIQCRNFDIGTKFDCISTKRSIGVDRFRRRTRLLVNRNRLRGSGGIIDSVPLISPFGFSEILQLDDPEERNTAGGQRRRGRFSAVRLGGRGGWGREMFLRIRRIRLDSHDR